MLALAGLVIAAIGAGGAYLLLADDGASDASAGGRDEALVSVADDDGERDVFVLNDDEPIGREDRLARGLGAFSLIYDGDNDANRVPVVIGGRVAVWMTDDNEEVFAAVDVETLEIEELHRVDDDESMQISFTGGRFAIEERSPTRSTCLVADGLVPPARIARADSCILLADGLIALDFEDDRVEATALDDDGTERWTASVNDVPSVDEESGIVFSVELEGTDRVVEVRSLLDGTVLATSDPSFDISIVDVSPGGRLLIAASDSDGDMSVGVLSTTSAVTQELFVTDESVTAGFMGENLVLVVEGDQFDDSGERRTLDLIAYDLADGSSTDVLDGRGLRFTILDGNLVAWTNDDDEVEVFTAAAGSLDLQSGLVFDEDGASLNNLIGTDETAILFLDAIEGESAIALIPMGGEGDEIVDRIDTGWVSALANDGSLLLTAIDQTEQILWLVSRSGPAREVDAGDFIDSPVFGPSGNQLLWVNRDSTDAFGELLTANVDLSDPATTLSDEASSVLPLWAQRTPNYPDWPDRAQPTPDTCSQYPMASVRIGGSFRGTGSTSGPRFVCLSSPGTSVKIDIDASFFGELSLIDLETESYFEGFQIDDSPFTDVYLPAGAYRVDVNAWEDVADMDFRVTIS